MTDSFLVDDDHETWCLLSSGALDESNSEVSKSLIGVEQRFVQDHSNADESDYWTLLITTAQTLGFAVQQQQSTATTTTTTTTTTNQVTTVSSHRFALYITQNRLRHCSTTHVWSLE
jgi:hypothetical protein